MIQGHTPAIVFLMMDVNINIQWVSMWCKTNKYDDLCDKHFEELYDIYDSLLG